MGLIYLYISVISGDRGGTVVKVLRYKVAGSLPYGFTGIFH